MKVQLTESQYNRLLEFQKRGYAFDWDDNILFMPTKIHLEKKEKVGDEWKPEDVTTSEFAKIRHKLPNKDYPLGRGYRLLNNDPLEAYKSFRDYDAVIKDAKEAIETKQFSPYFEKFKEALLFGNDFSIITARGNPPDSIKETIKMIIDDHFTEEEREEMKKNLNGLSIDDYLYLQDYDSVSSDEYKQKYGVGDASNPEHQKMMSLERFVQRVVSDAGNLKSHPKFTGFSVGFSDDDLGNIRAAEEFIRKDLIKKYPDVKFLVYDSSDPNNPKKNRIYLEKL
jgi:hypothetical protein